MFIFIVVYSPSKIECKRLHVVQEARRDFQKWVKIMYMRKESTWREANGMEISFERMIHPVANKVLNIWLKSSKKIRRGYN